MNFLLVSLRTLTLILLVLIVLSAFFSASETALTSCSKLRLKKLAKNGNERANKVLKLIDSYDETLSTILIGNNIVNIAAASISAAVCTAYFGAEGLAAATIITAIVVIIFGELLPKSAAKDLPEKFALFCAPLLSFLVLILTPLNFFFKTAKAFLTKVLKRNNSRGLTEDELLLMVDEVENDGAINKEDSELIKSAIEFSDIRVREIMTPRVDAVTIDLAEGNQEALKTFVSHGFSRLPVYKEDDDKMIGIIHAKDFFTAYINNPDFKLERVSIIY